MAEDEVVEACRFDHCVPARENIMAGRADVEVLRLSSIPRRDGLRPCTSERHGERCSRRCLIEPIEHEERPPSSELRVNVWLVAPTWADFSGTLTAAKAAVAYTKNTVATSSVARPRAARGCLLADDDFMGNPLICVMYVTNVRLTVVNCKLFI
jgi:hypothetical protein